jgi:hypothetical protein
VVFLLIFAGPLIAAILSGPSLWNLALLAAWISAAVAVVRTLVRDYKRLRRTNSNNPVRPMEPSDVPRAEVFRAVSATRSRADAIEALRQRHPGLGLVDAANLVNSVLGGPSR